MKKYLLTLLSIFGISAAFSESNYPANTKANQKTISALIEAGSNPDMPHPLEHHFYSNNKNNLLALVKEGERLGYKSAHWGKNDENSEIYWYVDLIKNTPLNLEIVNNENSKMLKLAHEYESDYDGWGTNIVQ